MSTAALDASVLVLNRSLVPLDMTTARRAFCMICNSAAEVVDVADGRFETHGFDSWRELSELRRRLGEVDDDSDWVSTVSFDIEVPRVIRVLGYNRYPTGGVPFNRRNIFARDDGRCQDCGRPFRTAELSLDHVVPSSAGGKTSWTNIVCACIGCNKRKGGRTPRQAGLTLIRKPVRPHHNPQIKLKLRRKKYFHSWRHFLSEAYWNVPLEED